MLKQIWDNLIKFIHNEKIDKFEKPTEMIINSDVLVNDDDSTRMIKFFLAGVIGVSEEEITPEFLEIHLNKLREEELAKARAEGKVILTTTQVEKLAQNFKSRLGNRERILQL